MDKAIDEQVQKIQGAFSQLANEINNLVLIARVPIPPKKKGFFFKTKDLLSCNNEHCPHQREGECSHQKQPNCDKRIA